MKTKKLDINFLIAKKMILAGFIKKYDDLLKPGTKNEILRHDWIAAALFSSIGQDRLRTKIKGARLQAATGSADRARHSRSVAEAGKSTAEGASNSQVEAGGLTKLASRLEGLASRFKI